MKTAAVYIRVSTDGQMEQSPESQLAEIRKFAARNDYLISDDYIFAEQDGISGRNAEKRPEFQRMIGVAKSGDRPFDAILVWKFSRFARNRQDAIIYKRLLRKQLGIEVVSVNENIGTDNDGLSELIEAMIEAMDEYYSLNLAEEVKRGMLNKINRGEAITHPPFGYKMINKKYVVDEERAPIVRMIFEDYAVNGFSNYRIARKLNDMGIRTHSGHEWCATTVRYMINNPVYIGKVRWGANMSVTKWRWSQNPNTILTDGIHEAIVPLDLWEKGQEIEQESLRLHKPMAKSSPPRTMLAGMLKCGNCGAAMCGAQNAYQCGGYLRGTCKVSHFINRDKIENAVIDEIDKILEGGEFEITPPTPPPKVKSEVEVIAAQIKKQGQKLDRIKEAYEAGVYDVAEMKTRLAREQAVLDELMSATAEFKPDTDARKQQLIVQRASIVEILRSDQATIDEKNALLQTFIDRIIFTRKVQRREGTIDIYLR
jgi:DNA invertase Pin-like site-specific DNA recombinase